MVRALLILLYLFSAMPAWAGMDLEQHGSGRYGDEWKPEPMQEYWDPESYHQPERELLEGVFSGEECIECHLGVTPGIVKDWQAGGHAAPKNGEKPVYCNGCHGSDHQKLHFPGPKICGECHTQQKEAFLNERRYGFPSHALAMERAVDSKHFADKPKAEVMACLQCHSVATKCDSCHTRHRFDPAEARRPEACLPCHGGPPHPDDESYIESAHGQAYQKIVQKQDWKKPLLPGNYKVPTCAYCHMNGGNHQVADKSIWKFGIREINPHTPDHRIKRKKWIRVCSQCHEANDARGWLQGLDEERQQAWKKLYQAEKILKNLRSKELIYPDAGQRPPYPTDFMDSIWPRIRIGFYEGQASAFYNVSSIERDYFEMWYFANLRAYKGAAHGAQRLVDEGHEQMDRGLEKINKQAQWLELMHKRADPKPLWMHGEYTDFNRDNN